MDTRERPQYFSRYGFENAPMSKLIIMASGAATASFFLMPAKHSSICYLHWPYVIDNKEVWRLITSQFVYGSFAELLYSSALFYNMRTLERHWGTRKFASFILATYSMTIGCHYLGCSFNFVKTVLPVSNTMASGLYGPLFALLVFYATDVYSGALVGRNDFSITNKWLTYFIALRMMSVNSRSYVAAVFGLMSGLLHRMNFCYIRNWLYVPDYVSNFASTVYNWFQIEKNKPCHRKTLCGATEEIHDDMMYDYMTKPQLSARENSRLQMGQGYADTLQSSVGTMHDMLTDMRMLSRANEHLLQEPIAQSGEVREAGPSQESNGRLEETTQEDKIQRLVEMGFTREAVTAALANSGQDIQSATNKLLSQ